MTTERFRFSLRSLLILTTIVAVAAGATTYLKMSSAQTILLAVLVAVSVQNIWLKSPWFLVVSALADVGLLYWMLLLEVL
jgi:hypothetical protein